MDSEIQNVVDALDDLLEEERSALLTGDLDRIARMHDLKSSLVERLNRLDVQDHDQFQTLSSKVGRNQVLLKSALEGIRAVAQRLAAVRRIKGSLDTYDATGRKNSVPLETDRKVEKRA